jgi:hypothetical protein
MPGSAVDPAAMTDAEKLNFLISQMASVTDQQTSLLTEVTTINTRLKTHGKWLVTLEKAPVGSATGTEDLDLSGGGAGEATAAVMAIAAALAAVDVAAKMNMAVATSTIDRSTTEARVVDMIVTVRRKAATVAPSSTSHLLTGRLTRCRGSTSARHFRGMRTMAEEKVWIASLHLKGVAVDWYYALKRDHAIPSWARFAEFMNMRFGPPLRTNSLAELKDLRRTGSVEEY